MFKNPHKRIYLAIFVSTWPFLWLFTKTDTIGGFIPAFANIMGFVGAVLMLWQFLLGVRFIASKIDSHYAWINTLHKRLGKYGSIFVLIHPVLQIIPYGIRVFTSVDLNSEFMRGVIFGRTAFYLYLIIFVTSALFRSKMKYRPWLYIHYLSYPLMFFVFFHASSIGTFVNTFPTISIYWQILTYTFYALVIYRAAQYLNLLKDKFVLIAKKKRSSDVTEYILKAKNEFSAPNPGQYYNIRFSYFGEAHPYSVMEVNENEKTISFGVKAVGPHSKKMEKAAKGQTFYLDGPYGRFTEEGQNSEPKILLAGGIGVTPFIELVKRFGNSHTYMFYSNGKLNEAVGRDILKEKLGDNYVDLVTREKKTGENIENGRISASIIKKYVPKSDLSKANVFVCGSPGFMNACDQIAEELGIKQNRVYKEEFSL